MLGWSVTTVTPPPPPEEAPPLPFPLLEEPAPEADAAAAESTCEAVSVHCGVFGAMSVPAPEAGVTVITGASKPSSDTVLMVKVVPA